MSHIVRTLMPFRPFNKMGLGTYAALTPRSVFSWRLDGTTNKTIVFTGKSPIVNVECEHTVRCVDDAAQAWGFDTPVKCMLIERGSPTNYGYKYVWVSGVAKDPALIVPYTPGWHLVRSWYGENRIVDAQYGSRVDHLKFNTGAVITNRCFDTPILGTNSFINPGPASKPCIYWYVRGTGTRTVNGVTWTFTDVGDCTTHPLIIDSLNQTVTSNGVNKISCMSPQTFPEYAPGQNIESYTIVSGQMFNFMRAYGWSTFEMPEFTDCEITYCASNVSMNDIFLPASVEV